MFGRGKKSVERTVVPGGPAEFAASIKDQADKLAQTAAVLGIKPKQ